MPFTGDQSMTSFNNLSEDEVTQLIHKVPSKSSELDPLPTHLLKQCLAELTPVITRSINASLSNAVVPTDFKKAVVTPLLKKPNLDLILKNYRPVSNLSFLSKLTERAVRLQMHKHLIRNDLFDHLQSAYRPNHSTETALI